MNQETPVLWPVPRRADWGSREVNLPAALVLVLTSHQPELLPAAHRFRRSLPMPVELSASACGLGFHVSVTVDPQAVAHEQGYRLTVAPGGISIVGGAAAGAAYGLATLKQMLLQLPPGRRLREVAIEDHPDFRRRGVMLDISRGKVPTMETLYAYVDWLADLKINEFQLYTEHTFAYREHRAVWQNYSPMTGEEMLQLDRYCRERFIDLVPNQNSFGHLKEWLVHPPYQHLAETLDGYTAWGIRFDGPFSLCPLEPAVPDFLAGLYDELLPHFTSQFFNVGCDETLDVGQGRSKEAVGERGEHRVYLDQLLKIYALVKAHGRTMQFWGDIIVRAPDLIAELPKDVVALNWGYEGDHPFDDFCGRFAAAGVPFYVCPGASNWNAIVGRTQNALDNLRSAAENGLKHGAVGYLNTMWGDNGYHDYQPVAYLPVAYGAAVSWALEANREADATPYLSRLVFGDRTGQIGRLLHDLGNIYQCEGMYRYNGTLYAWLLTWQKALEPGLVEAAHFDGAAERVRELAAQLDTVDLTCPDGALVLDELRNSVRLVLHALAFGKLSLALGAGAEPDRAAVKRLALDLDEIMAEHRRLWLARNRVGGLEEMSLAPLRKLRAKYASMM